MVTNVYAVYDKKAMIHHTPPFFMQHDAQAVRSMSEAINDKDGALSKYPDDFALYKLAEYDDKTGFFLVPDKPIFVIEGASLKKG